MAKKIMTNNETILYMTGNDDKNRLNQLRIQRKHDMI